MSRFLHYDTRGPTVLGAVAFSGPPFLRLGGGRSIRYRSVDVKVWLDMSHNENEGGAMIK
ncbi:hypothetical protein WDW86_15660 [Bdellovibrionota bacterium FG-2]